MQNEKLEERLKDLQQQQQVLTSSLIEVNKTYMNQQFRVLQTQLLAA